MSAPPDSPSQADTVPASPATQIEDAPPSPVGRSFLSQAGDEDMPDVTEDHEQKRSRKSRNARDKDLAAQFGRIRHLKKDDGDPLWRVDIQYDFLKEIFDNEQAVFTNSYETMPKQNFADLYIDTMARSTKTSKVLRDKLLSDREVAKGMAMVCLLVNMGRMNTTLNFFPEMRAQLRTYHAIPSLQARQDTSADKQLQDAPRLKSILKGGAEDRQEANSLDAIKNKRVPRTNPVNLIFVMCNTAYIIAELHFPNGEEFHDLIMKKEYTSKSRARAFLWLMWFHLESDFTEEGCDENPFGPGVDYGLDVANQGIPRLEPVDPDGPPENVDTPEEIEFGREKQATRAKILEMDQAYLNERENRRGKLRVPLPTEDGPAILPRIRPSKHESDMDSTRSTPPPKAGGKPSGANRRGAPLKYQIYENSSPSRPGTEGVVARKPRPPTAHQLAVERNRHERVEYILDRGLRKQHAKKRRIRRQNGAIFRAYTRVKAQANGLDDSDEDAPDNVPAQHPYPFREKGVSGGLNSLKTEDDDFGEEISTYAAALRRATRRLARWHGRQDEFGVIAPVKKPRAAGEVKEADAANDASQEAGVDDMEIEEVDQTALGDDEQEEVDRTELMSDV
ncbi:uncharacterized protein F5Z01DRAFT_652990 [Emericellopsis atlantica]|uniref:Ino eighty subunit 1 n=1 Tax=Emericellopsis atlantica TaxID=2614577 RepID=A0A9P8CS50_9HYPO|nr:uncharacterized protein F5Z01DRAFT_652990 [Emericellopsis atlantica]KAG9255391.1 hypothetical protein F5Z01DRAFT_652990 [Emericellopsis atlantica]